MALLLYLVEHAGHTVSREQLFEALWPGVVVSDDTLTQAVIKLRKALGDSARNARYIQTVPKRGYRLRAPVTGDSGSATMAPAGRRQSVFFVSLVLLAGLAGLAIAYFAQDKDPGREAVDIPVPVAPATVNELPSLTVQPFVLLGEEGPQAYLAQGITLDLITDLSKLSGLWVIGSRSIMGQRTDVSGAGKARYRVTGEVQRSADKLRVHVHLFDAVSGRQIWAERYHRPFENLFELQEEISRQIASSLSVEVSEAEHRRLAHRYTRNVQAYDYFLQAQMALLVRMKAENDRARQLYRQAITLDPSFARAYAGLALSFAADFRNQWVTDGNEALHQARAMARTALQIDAEIPEVYWVLAYVSTQQREHEKALGLLRKAISLDQSFADAYALMGGISTYVGRSRDTPRYIRTAIRLNPDAGYLYFLLLGRAYFFLQDWEQARINLAEALERNHANLEAHIYLAAVMASSGDHEGAAWEVREVRALQTDFDADAWLKTYPMTDPAQRQKLREGLLLSGLDER